MDGYVGLFSVNHRIVYLYVWVVSMCLWCIRPNKSYVVVVAVMCYLVPWRCASIWVNHLTIHRFFVVDTVLVIALGPVRGIISNQNMIIRRQTQL